LSDHFRLFESQSAVESFFNGLGATQTLHALRISECRLGDDGIHLLANALVRSSTLKVCEINKNGITPNGLPDITRMLEPPLQPEEIDMTVNEGVVDDTAATESFGTGIGMNWTLKRLGLSQCGMDNVGVRLFAMVLLETTIRH
jgi:Leucine Rich repeat